MALGVNPRSENGVEESCQAKRRGKKGDATAHAVTLGRGDTRYADCVDYEQMFAFPSSRPPLPDALAGARRPSTMASDRVLPLGEPWRSAVNDRGLRRGTYVAVVARGGSGGLSVLWHMVAPLTQQGYWVGVVGIDDPGVLAMSEYGVDIQRVLFVPRPGDVWADVVGDFLEGLDVVVVRAPGRPASAVARRLAARAREQRAVLVSVSEPQAQWTHAPDLVLSLRSSSWRPAARVMQRDTVIDVGGRLVGPQSREIHLVIPDVAPWGGS